MAIVRSTLLVSFFVCFFYYTSPVSGAIQIVAPFPGHPVVIEGEKVKIPCVAQDLENVTKPTEILFQRIINRYGDPEDINNGVNGNYSFENKTELNGLRITKYLIINNMKEVLKGRYECWASRPDDGSGKVVPAKYGFSILYIPKIDLPTLKYSESVTTEFGKPASLSCKLVPAKTKVSTNIVKLDKIAWFKNDHVTGQEKTPLEDILPNINLTMREPTDGGDYTCRLFTTLGLTRKYSISGVINVRIKPEYTAIASGSVGDDGNEISLEDNEFIRKKGKSVKFDCLAKGNPIKVAWKKIPRDSNEEKVLNLEALNNTHYDNKSPNGTNNPHYKFSDDTNRFQGFWMEIPDTDYDDRGQFKCCIVQLRPNDTEPCQTFTLRVKDPLGWLWPLIGIIVQAIIIVLILVIAACCKGKSGETTKIVKQTELSYSQTEQGSKGHIRLRNTGRTG